MKKVWVNMLLYAGVTFIAPYLLFMADVYGAWTADKTVKLEVPVWVWGYLTLTAVSQTLWNIRAYTDRSWALHVEDAEKEKKVLEAETAPPVKPPSS